MECLIWVLCVQASPGQQLQPHKGHKQGWSSVNFMAHADELAEHAHCNSAKSA